MVDRFDVAIKYPCGRDPYAVMVSVTDGSYVMAAHYDAARAEIERLKEECAAAWDKCEERRLTQEKAEAERDSFQAMFRSCLKGNDALREKAQKANTERDEARAQVVAAFEAAAEKCDVVFQDGVGDLIRGIGDEIRRLTPADAQAAIEAYGREKVREGMQKAANIARRSYERNKRCPEGCNCGDGFHIEQRILAEMEALK